MNDDDSGPGDARGFPSPAQDYFHGGIDLNRHLIRDRTCTFVMRVSGNSMAASGISDGDELIVADLCEHARSVGIRVGPGRGSAGAGSGRGISKLFIAALVDGPE